MDKIKLNNLKYDQDTIEKIQHQIKGILSLQGINPETDIGQKYFKKLEELEDLGDIIRQELIEEIKTVKKEE